MLIIAKVILINKDKILIVRRSPTHPQYAYQYDLPGGIVDDGETPVAAASREIKEETGLKVSQSALKLVYERQLGTTAKHLIYQASLGPTEPIVKLSWEHDKYYWLDKKIILEKKYASNIDPYFVDVISYLRSTN